MLKLRFSNNKHNAVWLVEPKVTIGSSSDSDLLLDAAGIEACHAEILVNHEKLLFKLLVPASTDFAVNNQPAVNQRRPTLINKKVIKASTSVELKAGDKIVIGGVELQVVDPKREPRAVVPSVSRQPEVTGWALKSNHTALANRIFALKNEMVVGRSNECDITLAAAHLSRRHAHLLVKEGLLYVRDLGSSNGTYLNGKRIAEGRVKRGDDIRFDTLSFGVIGPADDMDKTTVRSAPAAGKAGRASASKPSINVARQRAQTTHVAAPVETVRATKKSGGNGLLVGVGLLLIVTAGAYLAYQNSWF